MSNYTDNLNLKLTNMDTDGDDLFDFETDLNDNFTKLDEAYSSSVGADINLSNLANTGLSQYNPFCVNTGETDESGNPACIVLNPNTYSTMTSTVSLSDLSEFQATNNGYLTLNLDKANGSAYTVSHLDFTDATSYADIAEIIQAAIRTNEDGGELYTNATVEYIVNTEEDTDDDTEENTEEAGVFVLTAGLPGDYAIDYASDDTSLLLGWSEDNNPDVTVGDVTNLTTSSVFVCSSADGTIYKVTDTLRCDVYGLDDGTYNVFINPDTPELYILANTVYTGVSMPSEAVTGDYLLNTSKVPYSLDEKTDDGVQTCTAANSVLAGIITIKNNG